MVDQQDPLENQFFVEENKLIKAFGGEFDGFWQVAFVFDAEDAPERQVEQVVKEVEKEDDDEAANYVRYRSRREDSKQKMIKHRHIGFVELE